MMTSVFLSYARKDDEPFVKRLYVDLTAAGFKVWFDRDDLRSRGLTFHHEIRDAISAHDRLVLIVGPNAVASEYVRQEWQYAWFDAEKVVTPILRLNGKTADDQPIDGYSIIPDELKLFHCEDFRDDDQYQAHLRNLIASLSSPPPPLGQLFGDHPALPNYYLTRSGLLTELRAAVRAGLDSTAPLGGTATHQKLSGIISRKRMGGVAGMGGIGKSFLACLLARDRFVREAFPDGIVWVALGSLPKLAELMQRIHRDLGGDGVFQTEYEGKAKLKELLADKAVLLILDDAWRKTDVEAFDVLGAKCRALITTRDAQLLTSLGGTPHLIDLLSDDEALRLLAASLEKEIAELPRDAASKLLKECGRLPLAVSLAAGMIAAAMPWGALLDAFRRHRLEFFQDDQRDNQHHDLLRTIEVSVLALQPAEQARLVELGAFAEDVAIPEAAITTLWQQTGPLDDLQTKSLLIKLKQRSLLQLTPSKEASFTTVDSLKLHDLIHDYCLHRAEQDFGKATALDEKLLAAYRAKCSNGWPTGPNDGYFFQHLREHLAAAGHTAEAFHLLRDFDWLGAKTRAGLALDLTWEVLEVHRDLPAAERHEFLPWYYFVRQNASFVARHPETFFQQAFNEPVDSPVSQTAQQRWSNASGGPQTFVLTTCLPAVFLEWINRPAEWEPSSCLMTLTGHAGGVNEVGLSADGRTIVSGSSDNTIKVWDAESGFCRLTLGEHTGGVNGVDLSTDGRTIVSGSGDKTVKVWDAESGVCRQTLQGHTDCVWSVAVSADGGTIVSGSTDRTIKVWDAESGTCHQTMKEHSGPVWSVAVSADGRTIVSISYDKTVSHDKTVKVWDAKSGACRGTFVGDTAEAESAWNSVSPLHDSRRLSTKGGPMQFPFALASEPKRSEFAPSADCIFVPGPFTRAYGPLAGDTILAFASDGEAHWFRIRRRDVA